MDSDKENISPNAQAPPARAAPVQDTPAQDPPGMIPLTNQGLLSHPIDVEELEEDEGAQAGPESPPEWPVHGSTSSLSLSTEAPLAASASQFADPNTASGREQHRVLLADVTGHGHGCWHILILNLGGLYLHEGSLRSFLLHQSPQVEQQSHMALIALWLLSQVLCLLGQYFAHL